MGNDWGSRAVVAGLVLVRDASRVAVGGGGQEGQRVGRSRELSQPNPCLMVGEAR